ncbi:MAG: TetR/AcrR family transcriptional regulator [Planctomycetes bacterium]|nr:TetR/AcrR family transcriptional regulator [Planctomycetota bacterium]
MNQGATPTPKFRRRSEARPTELIEAALACFAEKGFAATRLADVGRRAGVSPGTVCLYFPTKERLFMAVIDHYLRPVIADQARIADEAGSPASRLRRLMLAKAESLQRPNLAALARIIVCEIGSFPEVGREFYGSVIEPTMVQIAQLIEEGIACGEFRQVPARVHAHILVAPLPFALIWEACYGHLDPQPSTPIEKMHAHIDSSLRALARDTAAEQPR